MAIDYEILFADIGSFITAIDRIRDMTTGLNSPRPNLFTLEESHQDQLTIVTTPPQLPPLPSTDRGRFDVLSGVEDDYVSISNGELIYENHNGSYKEAHRIDGANHDNDGVPQTMGLENYLNVIETFVTR